MSSTETRSRLAASTVVSVLMGMLATMTPALAGVAAAAVTPPLSVKVNFQPDATEVPAGFVKDTGQPYSSTTGYGWVRQDSLQGAHVPFGVPLNTRDRNACTALTAQQRTFIHMQAPTTNATNNATPVAWDYQLPNGTYQVSVGVGDANLGQDAESHTVRVEGVPVVSAFARSTAANCTPSRLTTATTSVTVTDGILTVDALGGTNTKLQYVTIDSTPNPVTGLVAAPGATSVGLDWDDAEGASSYKVFTAANLPVPTTGTPAATVTSSAWEDTAAVRGSIRWYAVVAVDDKGVASPSVATAGMVDAATAKANPLPVQVDFTSEAGAAVAGYLKDFGQNYSNERGYGWVVPGSAVPLNLVGNGRARVEAGLDPRLATLVHMQADDLPAPAAGTIKQEGAWQLALPAGSYDVEVAVGDATPGLDPTNHRLRVEGTVAVDGFGVTGATTGAARFRTATLTGVQVSDGFLTVDAEGGTNTKIDYITVTPTPADAKPAAPTGLTATAGDARVALDWADNGESDLAGYDVFRSTGTTVPTTGTPLNGSTPVSASAFEDTTAANDTTYRYAVVAVDAAGQRSVASASASATPDAAAPAVATLPLKVNFQDEGPAAPAGYAKDYGQPFSNTRGRGWVVPGTDDPLSLVGTGRTRPARTGVTPLQASLVHMQGSVLNPPTPAGAYEVAVPDGTYEVTVSAGDQAGATGYDSLHQLTVEGVVAVRAFQGTAAKEFAEATVTAEVTDGRLTVDATGGTNTKINYLEVAVAEPADTTAPAVPANLAAAAADGAVTLTWDQVVATDLAGYHVYRSTSAPVELSAANRVTAAPQAGRTYLDSAVANSTAYHYAVTAVDEAGNESAAATATATPADTTAPPAPTAVVAVAGVESVALRWSAGTATDVKGYRVYRSTTSPVAITPENGIASPAEPSYTDAAGLANGTTYYYAVVAVDTSGNASAPSGEASAVPTAAPDTTAPAAPTGLAATAGDARVVLAWTASTSEDVVAYDVYRAAASGAAGTKLNAAPLTGTAYTDTSALNATTYWYYVVASDLAGNASERSAQASATPRDTTAPAVPRGLTATAGTGSVTLRWDMNTETDLRGYRIYRAETATVPADEAHLVGLVTGRTGRTFLDSDLTPGTTYYYVLTAEDQLRNASAATAVVSATPTEAPDTTAPAVPTGLTAAADGTEVRLAWGAVTATDLAGYNVYRTSGSAPRVKVTGTPLTATTFTDASAPGGTASSYVVTSVDRSGNESAASAAATATPAAASVSYKVDFTTATDAVAAGYTRDSGAAFTAGSGQGWVRQDSLTSATRTPLDLTANTRDRGRAGIDPRLDSMIHLQYGDIVPVGTQGSPVPGAWERSVPNGRYTVTVGVGDQPGSAKTGCPAPCYDSLHRIRVEGVPAVAGFTATAAKEYETGTVTVDVTDGLLTLDAVGGSNTKLGYVDIASAGPVVPDTTAPAAPSGLSALPGDGSATLTWGASASSDAVSYNLYRGLSDVVVPSAATRVNTSPVLGLNLTDTGLTNGTTYHYVVTAVDQAGNESAASSVRSVVPAPGTGGTTVRVNFQDETTTPPAGYLADWGQAFGPRTSAGQGTGQAYGWVGIGTGTPLSLVGNGRNRNVAMGTTPAANQPDLRLATFMHMQLPTGATNGVAVPGSWELAVPNGAYAVTVAVGDAGTAVDSANWIGIENQNAVAAHVPTATAKFATATRTVVVSDGRLTVSPVGGTNTKIDYVDVIGVDRGGRPYSTAVTPANGATGVVTNASVTADNALSATDGAVDGTTLGGGNVRLTRVADGTPVAGRGVTSGGGDTVSFQADAPLAPSTLYRFEITDGAKDKGGRAFLPFSSVFTTAGSTGTDQPTGDVRAAFDKAVSGASSGKMYTSLVVGPDGKLYAGSITGQIYRWTIGADGTLSGEQVINTVRTHATQKGWEGAPNRTIIGMAFDPASTPANPILWITDNIAYLGSDVPNATGAIARLSGPNLEDYQEIAVNLPRSIKDHETNSIAIRDGKLYITQGSMNAMGATDGTWKRPENLLAAAVLELDPAKLPAQLPVDVATPDLQVPARAGSPARFGTYDPYAPGAPLTLYATGVRNAYDLVWHSNGHLYSGTNGSAAGGNTPATPAQLPASCAKRPDGGYSGPSAPAITGNPQAETDYVFDIEKGKYYGHPNPVRCEYVLNAGNPVGYTGNPLFKVNAYPLGQAADPNYDLAGVFDAGLHASANGTIEYKNTRAFGGAFAGKLVVVRYSANQELVAFDVNRTTGALSAPVTGLTGFRGFKQPLDVTEDVATGNLYVSELTDNPATTGIVLLKPQGGAGATGRAEVTERLVLSDVQGGAASPAQQVTVTNTGGGTLTVGGASATGTDAALFTVGTPSKAFPAALAPGESLTIPVSFAPTAAGPRSATLTVSSDDPRSATATTRLRGLGTLGLGGTNEPSLQWILQTLEIPVQTGDPDPTNNDMPATSGMLGDEVAVQSFTKAAFDRPVEVEALSLYGPAGPAANPNVVTIAAHTTGRPAERTVLLRGPNASNQKLLPAMTEVGEYDLETPFGLDFTWHGLGDRVAYSEDALNTWHAAAPHKVRVYPLKDASGALVPNAYVVAPEDVPSPVDYQDAVVVLRNVKPATTTEPATGKVTTSVPELVFSGVRGSTIPTQGVTVTNQTLETVTLSASVTGTHAGAFALTGGAPELAAGATATYQVRFAPTSAQPLGALSAALRLGTSSPGSPLVEVGLHGLATPGEQGGNEPPLKAVVDTLGHPVDVGGTGLILGTGADPIGDEVRAQTFVKLGAAPVTITPVARYSPDEVLPFGWYAATAGDPELRQVGVIALDNEQTLNPAVQAGGNASFDPGTAPFGLYVDSKSFGRVSYTQDGLNTGAGRTAHAARTYPAKDRTGKVVPGTYLVGFEDATNGDYQDYLFRVTGVRPASEASTGTALARVDFTTAAGAVAPGYTADTGAAWSDATGRGWVRPGTTTPLDMTAQTRERVATVDQRSKTLVLMQPTAAQSPDGPGAWELAVPNGTYQVTVQAGDPSFIDSVHTVRVEGQTAVESFVPTPQVPFETRTVTVPVSDGRLTLDAVGGTNTKITYVDVDRTTVTADTTAPVVTAAVSGLQQSAGTYKNAATVTVTATDAGSGVASVSYSLDGAPFRAYTAPVEVTTAGAHTVQARAVDVAGNIATSATTSFSVVVAAPSKAEVVLENADGVPFADRLVMNRIQNPQTGTTCKDSAACDPVTGPFVAANVVHDVSTLTIRNTGTEVLNVTGLAITGPFALATAQSLPALVPAGGTLAVPVRFTATTGGSGNGLHTGSLTVTSDDVDEPSLPVELAGFWQSVSEGGQEPDLTEIVRLFGYRTAVTNAGQSINQQGLVTAIGDEVLSPYWVRSSATAPVTVRQLGAFHTQGNTATLGWHAKASSSVTNVVTHAGADGQSILPRRNGSAQPASASFSPTGAFGFKIDSEWSDPARNNSQVDRDNGCVGTCGHHMRFWPVRDRAGAVVPGSWIVAMDYSGINYDYQDNVYLVTGMRPETAVDPAAPAAVPGAASLQLGFDAAVAGTVADKDGTGTGFTSVQRNKLDTTGATSSYQPALLDLVTAAPGTLAVASSGSATTGSNAGTDNTLVNGLQTAFDGTAGTFAVTGRLVGPVGGFDAGSEQAGVMLGANHDNFVKVAVIARNGVPSIEMFAEQGGTGATVGTPVAVPAAASVGALELVLVGDAAAGTVKGGYRIDGGPLQLLAGGTWTVPAATRGTIFDAQSKAGLIVAHKGGAAFTATYDSFAVTAGDPTAGADDRQALYRLDVAGSAPYTDGKGQVWTTDAGRYTPATAPAEGATTAPQEIAGTTDDVLYRTYRGNVGNVAQDQRVLTYALPTRAAGTVDLRLHFAERAAGNNAPGKRVFDIEAEGKLVRSGFDVVAAAGGQNTAVVLPVRGVTVTDGVLDLAFRASVDYPAIAAIEVLCQGTCPVDTTAPAAPTGLTATASPTGVALDWADNREVDVVGYDVYRATGTGAFAKLTATPVRASAFTDTTAAASTAYGYRVVALDSSDNASEASATTTVTTPAPPAPTAVRINAGGPAQTVGTTTWAACSSLTACSGWVSGGNAYSEADTITGIPAGLNNTVFQSEWTGGASTGAAVGARAFGFDVPVVNGSYAVRLHFAELNKTAAGQRTFDVRLEGSTVLTAFDVWAAAGGIDRAIVREFPVTVTDGKVTIDFLRRVENAKVSAIEILPVLPDTTAPAAPAGLTATGALAGNTLSWTARTEADLAGYNVYRASSPTGTYTKLNSALLTGTTFSDTAAPVDAAASYQVTAVDRTGNESVRSATATATRPAPDTTPPAAVTGVTATASAAGVSLSWTASAAGDLGGYSVYRASSATGTYTKLTTALLTGTTFSDTTAPQGVAAFYQVTATDRSANESARSATVSATRPDTTAPAAVTGLAATGSQTGVALTWSASAASDLAGYSVYRASSPTGTYTKLNAALVTGTTFSDTTAPQGVAASYQVTATDAAGNESVRSATATATRPAPVDTTAPAAVTGVTATGSQTGIALSWGASAASDLAGYSVYRASSPTGTYTKLNAALLTGTTFSDTTAPAGVASSYQVTATDRSGNESARSAAVSATRPGTTTQQPVRINTGGGAVTTGGVSWLADQGFTGGKTFTNPQVTAIAGTTDDVLYRTERSGTSDLAPFSYGIPVANGTYTVRLHFAEVWFGATGGGAAGTGKRVFSANIEGGAVEVANLDLNAVAAPMTAVVREFRVPVTDGRVDIAFTSTVNQAKVSAIEVLPTTAAPARPTVRINAGGPAQTVGSTTWSACTALTACSGWVSGGFAYSEADTITGMPAGTNQELYRSEWTGGATGTGVVPVGSRAFGFDVPVANGAYTVRLHFAELNKTAAGQRVFDVKLEGTEVLSRFDVRAQAGAIDRAIVREFPVTITDGRVTLDFIRRVENAKVSAIEIVPVG